MHVKPRTSPAVTLAVAAQIRSAEARDAVLDGAQRRLGRLGAQDESGAQAAEYAMLGGVSAAACTALIAILKNKSWTERVIEAVVAALIKAIKSWF